MHRYRYERYGQLSLLSREQRFFSKVEEDANGCWIWTGSRNDKGYGGFGVGAGTQAAHRWSWEFLRGEIPDGLHVDHLCLVTSCVNPWHFELVTPSVNSTRRNNQRWSSRERPATCRNGHELTDETSRPRPGRQSGWLCNRCQSETARASYERRKQRLVAEALRTRRLELTPGAGA